MATGRSGSRWAARNTYWYWVNVGLWMPSVFLLFAGLFCQLFIDNWTDWPAGKWPQIAIALALTWAVVGVGIMRLEIGKWVNNLGAIIKAVIIFTLGAGGIVFAIRHGSANTIHVDNLLPSFGVTKTYLPVIIYLLMGFELVSSMAGEVKNPQKQIPRAIFTSGASIAFLYLFATVGILLALPLGKLELVQGLVETFREIFGRTGVGEVVVYALGIGALYTYFTNMTTWTMGANRAAAAWMERAGLRTWVDAAGNQWGRREGPTADAPALVLGSHLDTVPDAGSYDGMLGVLMAIAVAERLQGTPLPFALEVVGFSDEEGARFGKALLGSQAVAGTWDPAWWELRDQGGVGLREAFTAFGLDPDRVGDAARRPEQIVAYLEAHIEQGPELEAADRSLGYVTTIAGARRFHLRVLGEARHAGGTPYPRRRDALVGAGEAIVAIERLARASHCIATVGRIEVRPGAVNVIAGQADLSLDLRAATDAERDAMWDRMRTEIEQICAQRGLTLEVSEQHRAAAAPCAPWLQEVIGTAIAATGDAAPMGLWSRAGHDAMAIAAIADIGMLFVRCYDGISHHPAEQVREIDVARGIDALEQAVRGVAEAWHADR